jgi:multiple sugar transport system ATP-binding protein
MREGREAEFWLDISRVHVFDPGTGENLTRDADAAAQLTRMAEETRTEQLEEARRESASVNGR